MNYETKEVVIKNLMTEGLQIRVEMNEECIEEYAEIYRNWKDLGDDGKLPPITVYYDSMGDEYYLADGFHRVIAAKRAGWEKITANICEGTFNEALKFALGANAKHGLHRTNADKRNAMEIAWANREMLFKDGKPSSRQLASICGVSQRNAVNYLSKTQVSNLLTPTALTPTREHLEERNESIRGLLADGKDRYGVTIPERIKPAFLSREPRVVIRQLGRIRETLETARLTGNIAFAHGIDYALRDLDATIRAVRNGQAFCVCRMCRGKGCGSCDNFGFQTKLQYHRVPSEYKAEEK